MWYKAGVCWWLLSIVLETSPYTGGISMIWVPYLMYNVCCNAKRVVVDYRVAYLFPVYDRKGGIGVFGQENIYQSSHRPSDEIY